MNTSNLTALTELAFQFGPFFFALLFTLVISRWSYKIYHAQGKSSTRETDTYRWVFISTTAFGMILVIVSVIWWWNYRPTTFVFRGEIKNLKEYERVVSSSLYFKSKWTGVIEEGVPQYHDEEFAVIQDVPFSLNQQFDMMFSKRDGSPQKITVGYDRISKMPQFEIVWDDSTRASRLIQISKSAAVLDDGAGRFLIAPAYAGEANHRRGGQSALAAAMQYQVKTPVIRDQDIIKILQDERTGVGLKIASLDRMLAMDATDLRKIITTRTNKEDMILTITDLTRHTDKELASQARRLADKGGVNAIISGRLKSSDSTTVREAQNLVRRLDTKQVTSILKLLDARRSASMKGFVDEVQSGRGLNPLKPTGSSQGDRYYVRAKWDQKNDVTVNCLARLFSRELVEAGSPAEEAQRMKGRSERWVYWYSKDWALRIAGEVKKCGGTATFESP